MRLLKADEIDLRVKQVIQSGTRTSALLLAYKDARCDMNILDEVYTPKGWQRKHEIIGGNLYCTVSIWDEKTGQWISKQDVGTESNTEKEKGQASDSFKRACFNLGIGRELYTAPTIWIELQGNEIKQRGGKPATYARFKVKEVEYNEKKSISYIVVVDEKGSERYKYGTSKKMQKLALLAKLIGEKGLSVEEVKKISYDLFKQTDSKKLDCEELKALIEHIERL